MGHDMVQLRGWAGLALSAHGVSHQVGSTHPPEASVGWRQVGSWYGTGDCGAAVALVVRAEAMLRGVGSAAWGVALGMCASRHATPGATYSGDGVLGPWRQTDPVSST